VQRRQAEKFAGRDAQIAADRDAAYQQQTAAPASPSQPAPASGENDVIAQLKQLGELHAQGVLTDEEFAAQKAKILG